MNCISNLPDLSLYWLQQQNITKKITKIPETLPPSSPTVLEISETKPITSDSNEVEVQSTATNMNVPPVEIVPLVETNIPAETMNKPTHLAVEIPKPEDSSRTVAAEAIDTVIGKITANQAPNNDDVVVKNI